VRLTTSRLAAGELRNVKEVTTPTAAPPPRRVQKRSAWSSAAAVTTSPLGSTTTADSRASHVRPRDLASGPSPPPKVNPETPTVGQLPVGIVRPDRSRVSCTEFSSAADETVTRPVASSTTIPPGSRRRSMIIAPLAEEAPT